MYMNCDESSKALGGRWCPNFKSTGCFCISERMAVFLLAVFLGVFGVVGRAAGSVLVQKTRVRVTESSFMGILGSEVIPIKNYSLENEMQAASYKGFQFAVRVTAVGNDVIANPFLFWNQQCDAWKQCPLSVFRFLDRAKSSINPLFVRFWFSKYSEYFSRRATDIFKYQCEGGLFPKSRWRGDAYFVPGAEYARTMVLLLFDAGYNPRAFGIYKGIRAFLSSFSSIFLMRNAVAHRFRGIGTYFDLLSYRKKGKDNGPCSCSSGPSEKSVPTWLVPFGIFYVLLGMIFIRCSGNSVFVKCGGFLCGLLGGMFILNGYIDCQSKNQSKYDQIFPHGRQSVTQKCLTSSIYCNTVIDMANVLPKDKQIAVIASLAEGSSIRSIERMTGIHRDTIMRL